MTSTTAQPATPAQQQSRWLILTGAIVVALISTGAAYTAMVGFGIDVLAMGTVNAYVFAGVLELSLVTVAVMAREASQHNRPTTTLLALTWMFSAASGFFAGWHEIHLGHAAVAAGFRFIVPLLAALMWHLALIGDRHLATGRTFAQLRANARLAVMFRATRIAERAYHRHQLVNTKRTLRQLERAQARQDRAEDRVLDTVPPAEVRAAVTEWRAAVVDVADTTTDIRLHESRRLIALRAPREIAGEPVAINPAPAEDVLQELPAPGPQVAEIAAERPVVAPVAESPAEEPAGAAAAPEAAQPAQEDSPRKEEQDRPRLAAVPAAPKRQSTTPATKAEKVAKACELRDQDKTVDEIAAELDVAKRTVYRWFEKVDAAAGETAAAEAS